MTLLPTLYVYEYYIDGVNNKVKFNSVFMKADEWSTLYSMFIHWFNTILYCNIDVTQEYMDEQFRSFQVDNFLKRHEDGRWFISKKSIDRHEIDILHRITTNAYEDVPLWRYNFDITCS